ncbi:hypothetical protein N7468_003596 [Penicillium chermesinum]|uniref:BRCT domain-containing protein n=1 Tax=Penicillium chermesinum TaxID=63820 RepID=A0A9W9P9K3_9EURO|nr:uncharacterized protein N7468_003596 [Penicillium chermesinum]KAJ5238977.1 hypothetical protein N7468_003596 [Penicillium chermesinum]
MGLSQLFKATQAPSSPLVNLPQPELMSDRPSPDIPMQHTRLIKNVSSPLVQFARESSEPNMNYISMQESQSRRDRTLGERLTRSADHVSDPLDLEFDKESSFVENARRQREIDQDTTAQFAALNAPSSTSHARTTSLGSLHDNTDVPQSQEVPPSSEEDKENYAGPLDAVVGTSSAHERLSQVLAMGGTSSSRVEESVEGANESHHDAADMHEEGHHYPSRSSQIMVMDSQQSQQPSPKRSNETKLDTVLEVAHGSRSSDEARTPPPVRYREQSSPPIPRPIPSPLTPMPGSAIRKEQGQPNDTSFKENRLVQFNQYSNQAKSGSQPYKAQSGAGDKPSSLPSRITETPVHLRPAVHDLARLTRIPETSPSKTHNNEFDMESNPGANENEDDDLPPMFPRGSQRFSQIRPSQNRALSSPLKVLQSQAVPQVLSSPSGRQRRRLTEIASECSPIGDFKMTDINMEFLTADDEEFNSLVIDGSPTRPRKRRRGNLGQSLHTSDLDFATPRPPKTVAPIHENPLSQNAPSPISQVPATTVRKQANVSRRDDNVWDVGSSPQQPIPRRKSRHRTMNNSRQSERHRLEEHRAPLQKTDVKTRAPTQLVAMDNSEPRAQRPPSQISQSETRPEPETEHEPEPEPEPKPEPEPEPQTTQASEGTDINSDDLPPSDSILPFGSHVGSSPPTTPSRVRITSDSAQIAPRQVLAIWMGQKRAYYPATCFGTPIGVSQDKYSVKFEDSLPVDVVKGMVKRLEFRVGDAVKVDMRGVPKVTHIVRGFADKVTREELAQAAESGFYPQTDVYGHKSLILGPKQRKSLPNGGLNSSENVITVPISRIYLDSILWNQLKDNAFTFQPEMNPKESSVHSPSEKSSLPASPSVRFSRAVQSAGGLFTNMAFAISYKEDERAKNRITKLITDNGGSILHDGFTELFEPSSIFPSNTPTKGNSTSNDRPTGLQLTSLAENIGFSCLIADSHSRREKYMQALALGLPCLSGRWVEDCVAKGQILEWDIYLLPAGDSMYLNGATKSRVMNISSPVDALLPNTIASRSKLLDGQSVLIVTGRGKAEEKRKAYIFLTYALGASRVERVPDLETARALVESQSETSLPCPWDLIYVDDADQPAAQVMLTPRSKTQRISLSHGKAGRKRKKSSALFPLNSEEVTPVAPPARVVGNEFVCQSLILGRLVFD